MTLFHKMPFSALYWAGSTLRSFLSQFQGQFEAKNTFFDWAVADLSWHFTKNFIKYKLLFLARSNGALLSRSSISQKLGALQLFEIIRLFKVYGGSIFHLKHPWFHYTRLSVSLLQNKNSRKNIRNSRKNTKNSRKNTINSRKCWNTYCPVNFKFN